MSRVRVAIDKLVLKGFEPGQREALVDGLQGELARVLADATTRGEWARSRRMPMLSLGRMPLEPGASAGRRFGNGMARGIIRGLKP
jgi:hypothetical protein